MSQEERKKNRLFSKLYDQNIEGLYRFVYLKVSSEAAAKDIVSDTFVRLWEQMKAPTEVDDPRAYLYQVARNLIVDQYRTQEPSKVQPELVVLESEERTPEEEAVRSSDRKTVREALARLKSSYQDVLIFYYVEGRSIADIALMGDKTENAVRVMIHRALQALEKEIHKS